MEKKAHHCRTIEMKKTEEPVHVSSERQEERLMKTIPKLEEPAYDSSDEELKFSSKRIRGSNTVWEEATASNVHLAAKESATIECT